MKKFVIIQTSFFISKNYIRTTTQMTKSENFRCFPR